MRGNVIVHDEKEKSKSIKDLIISDRELNIIKSTEESEIEEVSEGE